MEACTKWWVRRCLNATRVKPPARLFAGQSSPSPTSPGVAVSVDYFGPLPIMARENSYILLFTGRFSRRPDMFAVTAAEFAAEGTANILVNRCIPLWGCPSTVLSDNGPQFCARLATAVYKLLGIHKLTTSAYHPSGNGGVERVNHTMAQMLAMVCNEHQNDWDVHLPHVEYAYNNSVSAATGLAPNKVHKEQLSLNWTGPFKILAVGPSSAADTPDGHPLGDKLLYLDLPSNLSGPAVKPRVTVARCKPCANPYDAADTATSPCRPHAICLTRLRDQIASLPRHHR